MLGEEAKIDYGEGDLINDFSSQLRGYKCYG